MRVNYVLPGYNKTGGVQTVLKIIAGLASRGHDVSVTLPGRPRELRSFKDSIHYADPWISRKPFSSIISRLLPNGAAEDIRGCMLEEVMPDCDVNVATYWTTVFPVYRSGAGQPFYHMQHFEPMIVSDPRMSRMARETYHMPLRKFANSSWLRGMVQKETGVDVPIVNPALDHEVFYPRECEREDGRKRVLAFGKEHLWKGVPDLLAAMELVKRERNDVALIMYGSRPISHKREGVPYEFILGPSYDELAKLYASAHVAVCPSWLESFPLPPLEAMACGTPVVTTQFGTEDYAVDGDTALVVPPREPKAMAKAILRALEDEALREHLRKRGLEKAKEYTWERTVDSVLRVFREGMK